MRAASDAVGVADDRDVRLDALYRAEYDGMVRLAFTLVGSNAEAEELVQDSFVEVFRRLDDIRNPGGYLRTAVVSRCHSALRRRRLVGATPPPPPSGLPEGPRELWDVLALLSEDQRIAVVLRFYGGYRATEIARIVRVPAATVRSRIRRGLALLREELEP